jgi:class 3 adenylate cyclase/predicted ATPase
LAVACSSCGFSNEPGEKFCGGCGLALEVTVAPVPAPKFASPQSYTPKHLVEKILTSKSALEGERKQVTVLFADLKGSMELLAERDPEEARKLLDPVLEHMIEAVHRYEGTVNQVMGDGIMALFGAPLAHEDHAVRGCYAALRMQDAVNRYSNEVQRSQGIPVMIRVGLNSGEVVVGSVGNDLRMDYTAVGQTTHLAARMEQMAKPGSIMVSNDTHKLTEGFFQYTGLGQVQVKGMSEPVEAYELTAVGPLRTRFEVAARRGLVRFVGRQSEMEQMKRALDLAKGGRGQIVGVMGEPGVGKSRLFYEFKILEQSGCLVLQAFSVSHGKAYPYLPLIEFLKDYFQIVPQDDERTRREKVAGKVVVLDCSLEDTLPYLSFLLGMPEPSSSLQQMDAQIRRQRTLDAIKRLLLRESLNQPLLVVFEDLHWVDGETQAFLDILSESVASARVLLLVNYRPEYRHSWGHKTYYTQLRLDPLGQALLGHGASLKTLLRLILEKTEGNPFFMEEVVQTLAEEKVLVGVRGDYRLEQPTSELQIPSTVQVALAARIDRLGAEEKGLLQTLAVIGRLFPMSLIKRVVEKAEDELHRLLFQLQAGEFIYEQPAYPEMEYTFKHALTQEVAYKSVLIERRQVLHELTGRATEELYPDRLEEHYNELAHHYSSSGNAEKAVVYRNLAGQQAVQRSAHVEAIAHFAAALELIKALPYTSDRPQQELELQTNRGLALMATKGFAAPELEKVYARARALCQEVGKTPNLFRVLWGLSNFYIVRAQHQQAREVGNELLTLAQHQQDAIFLLESHFASASPSFCLGEFAAARNHWEQVIALYDSQHHPTHVLLFGVNLGVFCRVWESHALWYLGYPDQALAMCQDGLDLAQELYHPFSQALALDYAAMLHQFRWERHAAHDRAESAISLCTEHGFAYYLAWGRILRGWALAEQKQLMAEACAKTGRIEEGLSALAEALAIAHKTGERFYEAELHRIKGELLLRQVLGDEEAAEGCFQKALEVTRSQEARSLELRAVMSLSRLWQKQGKKEEARQMLAEIYDWFTEGFDTADLKEAKALLQELS